MISIADVPAVLVGAVSGVLSGVFGIGGGIITTPALRLLLGAPAIVSVGTPLPVIIPGALAGAWAYVRTGSAETRLGVVLGLVGAVASVMGAWATRWVGGSIVLLGTAAIIIVAAADMMLQAFRAPAADGSEAGRPAARRRPAVIATIALLTGGYSGFFGLGGGFVLVPMLTRWLRIPLKRAIGTSLVTVAILAVPGTVTHAALGNVDWRLAGLLAIGVVPGALLGARINRKLGERSIRLMFAVVLAGVAIWLVGNELAQLS